LLVKFYNRRLRSSEMKYSENIRDKELRKLKESTYFDEETLKEIREDLDELTDQEVRKNKETIKKNQANILKMVSKESEEDFYRFVFS